MGKKRRRKTGPKTHGINTERYNPYARISPSRARILLIQAGKGRMDAVQELMEKDAVNSLQEWLTHRPHRADHIYQLCKVASGYWANQTKFTTTRLTPTIAAYAHYLRWMAWTLHPIEEDDL